MRAQARALAESILGMYTAWENTIVPFCSVPGAAMRPILSDPSVAAASASREAASRMAPTVPATNTQRPPLSSETVSLMDQPFSMSSRPTARRSWAAGLEKSTMLAPFS